MKRIGNRRLEVTAGGYQLLITGGRRITRRSHGGRSTYFHGFALESRKEEFVFRLGNLLTWWNPKAETYFVQEGNHDRIYDALPHDQDRLDAYFAILDAVEKALTEAYPPPRKEFR